MPHCVSSLKKSSPESTECYPPGSRQVEGPSPYEIMLESAPSDYLTNLEGASHELPPEYPVYYFFYGTLKAPATLKRILDLPQEGKEPELRPAQIIGYALNKRGDYPALVDSEQGQVFSGSAYLVQSGEQAQKLACYATRAYKVFPCRIRFMDDEAPAVVSGRTNTYQGQTDVGLS